MPQEGQKTVTFIEKDLKKISEIAESEERSLAGLLKLLIWESFGTEEQVQKANHILTSLREKYK